MHSPPKPSPGRTIDAIQAQTLLAVDDLSQVMGDITFDGEQVIRRVVTRAIERGIELQRAAILLELLEPEPTPE